MAQNPAPNLQATKKSKIAIIFAVLIAITVFGFSAAFVIGKIAVVLAGLRHSRLRFRVTPRRGR